MSTAEDELTELQARIVAVLDAVAVHAVPHAGELLQLHRLAAERIEAGLAAAGGSGDDAGLLEMHRLDRRLVEEVLLPRLGTMERVQAGLDRLKLLGPVSEIVEQGPVEAAQVAELDRVLLSRIEDGMLVPHALHVAHAPEATGPLLARLHADPARVTYPLLEAEMLRRRHALLVDGTGQNRMRSAFADIMGWHVFVVAPILLEGRVIGFMHGDRRPTAPSVRTVERDALRAFANGFATVYERAIVRRRVRVQRQEMRQISSWADARASQLSDGAIDLSPDTIGVAEETRPPGGAGAGDPTLRDLLTRREIDVLQLLVKGQTNAGIARELVVSEGTVKFHVKNVLRKLHASNRAEATSRYLRLSLRRDESGPAATGGARPWPS